LFYQVRCYMCGIAAVALKKPDSYHSNGGALYYLHLMLNELQHRGQETAGFFTFSAKNGKTLEGKKSIGILLIHYIHLLRFLNRILKRLLFKILRNAPALEIGSVENLFKTLKKDCGR